MGSEDTQLSKDKILNKLISAYLHTILTSPHAHTMSCLVPPSGESQNVVALMQQNVKNTLPSLPTSEIKMAIQIDHAPKLDLLLKLGEFDKDTSSHVAEFLAATGIQYLMYMCVDDGAPRCLSVLMKWAQQHDINLPFDKYRLIQYATTAAFEPSGNLSCLLKLLETKVIPDEDTRSSLYEELMYKAKSGQLIRRLFHLLPVKTTPRCTRLIINSLLHHCRDPHTPPNVILTLLDLLPNPRHELNTTTLHPDGTPDTALSSACRSLNTPAMELLLRRGGAHPAPTTPHPSLIPLYAVVAREISVPVPAHADGEQPLAAGKRVFTYPDDKAVYDAVGETATRMHRAVRILNESFGHVRGLQELPSFFQLSYRAVALFADTLRFYLLSKMRRHLTGEVLGELIEPVTVTTGKEKGKGKGKVEEEEYRFREGVTGRMLIEKLRPVRLDFEDRFVHVWYSLLTFEAVDYVQRVVTARFPEAPVHNLEDVLYEYILLEPGERGEGIS